MDKLKYIKLENEDGSYSNSIPLAVDSDYVDVNGNTLTNELANRATVTEVDVERSRIDNLATLKEGSTTGDAELIDIRTGYDGTIYSSAGNSIRQQAGDANRKFNSFANGTFTEVYSTQEMTDITRLYVNMSNGHWYSYNGARWVDNGRYRVAQNTSILPIYTNTAKKVIKELYIENLQGFEIERFQIVKASLNSSGTGYVNIIRVSFDLTYTKYAEIYYKKFTSQSDAEADLSELNNRIFAFKIKDSHTNNKVIKGYAIIDTTLQNSGTNVNYTFSELNDVTDISYSPKIMKYVLFDNKEIITNELNSALENAIGANNSYQCLDQFKNGTLVKVYQNGILVNPNNYTLYKQGKIVFNNNVTYLPSEILFEYEKHEKKLKDFSNDLSTTIKDFSLAKEEGYADNELYSFVSDPAGGSDTVLKCFGNEVKATKFRVQFDYQADATEFEDTIQIYVPQTVLNALISYSGEVKWFSFGGAWCPFGGIVGSTTDMYSGQGTGFNLGKIEGENKIKYFIENRVKHYNTSTGAEIFNTLSSAWSDFEVKGDEWITIKRELRVGNPGYCKMTVTDSDGEHILTTGTQNVSNIAYLGVPDPENEVVRYGNKVSSDIPYRMFKQINLMKIYTSNAILSHFISENIECALYFKNYAFSGKIVNAYDD